MSATIKELRSLARRLSDEARRLAADAGWPALQALENAANEVAESWSGSSIGYHARIYYAGLEPPPPGAHFSQEWGFLSRFQGTTGDWREYRRDDVLAHIDSLAGKPDIVPLETQAAKLRDLIDRTKAEVKSIVSISLQAQPDDYLAKLLETVEDVTALTFDMGVRVQLPRGAVMSRDVTALQQGVGPAPHQEVLARVVAVRSAAKGADDLADLVDRAVGHLTRREAGARSASRPGKRVFIGHGRAAAWRELKDFIQDRLQLPWEEYNRRPTAGHARTQRLQEMLDSSSIALLVLTAEDELKDGSVQARQNVVHEAGLFQGRLGWTRAIILMEEGCVEFSNIAGLDQIRFPSGQIAACFEEVRRVLEREGLI